MSHTLFTSPLLPDLFNGLLGSFGRPSRADKEETSHTVTFRSPAESYLSREGNEQPGNSSKLIREGHEMQQEGTSNLSSSSEKDGVDSAPESCPTQRAEDDTSDVAEDYDANMKQAFVEVFVGGLPPDATDEGVESAFAAVGPVLSVRLNRRKKTGECKGFGFIRYADQATAENACQGVKEACGRPVGVHISRARSLEQAVEEEQASRSDGFDPEAAISKLLRLLRNHSDKRVAINAAMKAVLAVQSKPKPSDMEGLNTSGNVGAESGTSELADAPDDVDPRVKEDDLLPDPSTFLENFPRCKRLVDTFRANPNTHNKTPLAVLHEYATRLSLELMYDESADSNLGPFTVDARLTSIGGSVLYATGEGRGRGKKDAKQVAAAAVLEMLLANVPEQDFLQPGKGKFLKLRVNPRSALVHPSRGGLPARNRGRGRWGVSRGRGIEFSGGLAGCPPLSNNTNFDFQQYGSTGGTAQDLDMYGLPAPSPSAAGKVRSFLAGQQQDVDLLRSLRGYSLDTFQRQLAGLPVGQDAPLGLYGNSRSFDNSGFTFGHNAEQEQALLQARAGGQTYNGMATVPEGSLQMLGMGHNGMVNLQSQGASNSGFQVPLQHFPPY